MITVPIYTLLSDRDMTFIINNTKISVIVCDKVMLQRFVRLHPGCPSLRRIVCMDLIPGLITNKHTSLSVYYMDDIEKVGARQQYPPVITQSTDCLTIIYTSGSSGFPKGVMISDSAFRSLFPEELSPSTGEYIVLSYHPLAWYGGRNNLFGTFLRRGRGAFSTGNASHLMEELALIRPTIFPAPPNIWNKIYSEFKTALSLIENGDRFADRQKEEDHLQQFSKLIPLRCESISIVGALVSPIVLYFLKRCFRHCRIKDGYGITECGRVAFNNSLDPSVVYCLESVPEMEGCELNNEVIR
jgi:long-subunit acyl-CoA synthetase (AMP-forming)